jgi:hypothetical protein
MITKNRIVLVLVLAIAVCAFLTHTAQAQNELVSPEVYKRFQALGSELSRDTQGLDRLLSRLKHKKGAAELSESELAEFRSLRKSITGRQR